MNLRANITAIAASCSFVALACAGPGGGGGPVFPPDTDVGVGGDTAGDTTPAEVAPNVQPCAAGEAGGVSVSGVFNVHEGFTFDSATVALEHKMDVDAFEDGCLTLVRIDLGKGFGCKLVVEAGGSVAAEGGLRVERLSLAADSQCPGFPDDSEGEYADPSAMQIALVVPDAYEVPDENAPESCIAMNIEVRLEGVLKDGNGRTLTIAATILRLTGEMGSTGSTTAQCPCVAKCSDRECGADTCGFSCGACGDGERCESATGQCMCQPSCGGPGGEQLECGDDGCGGSCGSCAGNESCGGGQCIACQPSCGGRQCGDDGCGGSCGGCATGDLCQGGQCVCQPDCGGALCGDDGCGGSCGTCDEGTCEEGQCVAEPPPCGDMACDPGEETTCPTDCLSLVCNDVCEQFDFLLCPTDCD